MTVALIVVSSIVAYLFAGLVTAIAIAFTFDLDPSHTTRRGDADNLTLLTGSLILWPFALLIYLVVVSCLLLGLVVARVYVLIKNLRF